MNKINPFRTILLLLWFFLLSAHTVYPQSVLTGIEVLKKENFAPLKGQRTGIITNHTGIDHHWQATIDVLYQAPQVSLQAIFTPEHGLRGTVTGKIASQIDTATGLPIYSLYGDVKSPTADMLQDIDVLVFDIQDIGTRFYTYIGTMKNCMQAAAEHDIEFIVLDRPNPINGIAVEGPVLAPQLTFELAGIHSLPIRHGMTVGELARMFQAEDSLNLELRVIRMRGWKRSMWFDETGLPWINPSPNIRSLSQAILYPGIGLLERLNVNNKRGLDRPFEMFGAPWIDAIDLAARLNACQLPGVQFMPLQFTSPSGIYAGQQCHGVAINLVDRHTLESVSCGIEIIRTLYNMYPQQLQIDRLWHLLRSEAVMQGIKKNRPTSEIINGWQAELAQFKLKRRDYLLY